MTGYQYILLQIKLKNFFLTRTVYNIIIYL